VFNVGAIGLDNIAKLELLSREAFEKSIGFKLNRNNYLVTFHPVTLENGTAKIQFQELVSALDALEDTHLIFTKTNADTDGRAVNAMIDEFVSKNPSKAIAFTSLGQLRYLSALQFVDAVVGNSSSGLIEAPSFKVGTINIGDRQKGRIRASSVIDCVPEKDSIARGLTRLKTPEFQQEILEMTNPYGFGGASGKTHQVLASVKLDDIVMKSFFDLQFAI